MARVLKCIGIISYPEHYYLKDGYCMRCEHKKKKRGRNMKIIKKTRVEELLEEANDLSIEDLRDLADGLNALADCLVIEEKERG